MGQTSFAPFSTNQTIYDMKKTFALLAFLLILTPLSAQSFLPQPSDTAVVTEYYDGHEWAYHRIGNIVVGMTNFQEKNDYGRYYRIEIILQNHGEQSITFDPDSVSAILTSTRGEQVPMKVYTYERFMKSLEQQQFLSGALNAFTAGLNANSAAYKTSSTINFSNGVPNIQYSTTYDAVAATTANMAAQKQIQTLGSIMENDKKVLSQGYLKKTTIHPDESIIGFMYVKHKKGQAIAVCVDIEDVSYVFNWDIVKKKKK